MPTVIALTVYRGGWFSPPLSSLLLVTGPQKDTLCPTAKHTADAKLFCIHNYHHDDYLYHNFLTLSKAGSLSSVSFGGLKDSFDGLTCSHCCLHLSESSLVHGRIDVEDLAGLFTLMHDSLLQQILQSL